ncbi:erythromycin esterase family protein [Streptomyces sp. NPDC101145]|uniref:erythromycin esterase family protein n=1 Tax=Streptomyces sp. NPDC101145 TaxID=3366112 RepID=UPI00380806B2
MTGAARAGAPGGDARRVRADALPLTGPGSLDPLMERIGDARYVLIGEASHGTAEFYRWRAELTRRLVEERGVSFVAVEGDWPDCLAVHHAVTGAPGALEDPREVLAGFRRWPAWMWANTDVADFVGWLGEYNRRLPAGRRVGFYGLDVYSLWESLHAVLGHLRRHDPDRVEAALEAYRCFEPYAEDPQEYARAARLVPSGCEPEVLSLLVDLRRGPDVADRGGAVGRADRGGGVAVAGRGPGDRLAELALRQNAEVVAGAEAYYRAMVRGGPEAWNIRDRHMADTLDRLMRHHGPGARAVVWEHNTHIGDARATGMADAGMVNVGRLVRERHLAEGVVLIGFGSYEGTVLAADFWGAEPRVMRVPPARSGSLEHLMHEALPGQPALFVLPGTESGGWTAAVRDHRAIGVVYHAARERWGNYVPTLPADRYDAFLHLDRTTALTPLRTTGPPDTHEEETWPTGM